MTAPPRTCRTTVTGDGVLAAAVTERLAGTAPPGTAPPGTAAPAAAVRVVVADGWSVDLPEPEPGEIVLPVHTELGTVVVGPARVAGRPGCARCVAMRERRAREDGAGREAVLRRHGPELAQLPSRWLTPLAADVVGALVAAEVAALTADPDGGRTTGAVLHVDLLDLSVTRHRFLPEPLCPACGGLPDDTAAGADVVLRPRPKPDRATWRTRPVADRHDELVDLYVDGRTGLVRSLLKDTLGGLVIAGAMTPMRGHDGIEPGVGRSRSYRESELTALLEAIERWGGTEPGGRRTRVVGGHDELVAAGHAVLDPRTLGVHPDESYARDDVGYRPFDPQAPYRWVWGWSFARRGPLLVPEHMAYYHLGAGARTAPPVAYEISNGCALGSCWEEAALYGLLEAVERDAFLCTWYHRTPAPRIDLASARDPDVPLQAAAITATTGCRVAVFDTTREHGVPSVWALAVSPDGDPLRPAGTCAAAAHPSMEKAVLNALSELGPLLADLVRRYPAEADRAAAMVADPDLVATMPDHSVLYGHADAFARLSFLDTAATPHGPVRSLGGPVDPEFAHDDLTEDLERIAGRYVAAGQDVVVVDQTTPEHRAGGFACVKVLAPGLVPMTFGHHLRRTEGLPRLAGADPTALHAHPHPFP